MICQVCGRARVKRWDHGLGVCGKLAHRLGTRKRRSQLAVLQRRQRSELGQADADKKAGIFLAFGRSLKAIFRS